MRDPRPRIDCGRQRVTYSDGRAVAAEDLWDCSSSRDGTGGESVRSAHRVLGVISGGRSQFWRSQSELSRRESGRDLVVSRDPISRCYPQLSNEIRYSSIVGVFHLVHLVISTTVTSACLSGYQKRKRGVNLDRSSQNKQTVNYLNRCERPRRTLASTAKTQRCTYKRKNGSLEGITSKDLTASQAKEVDFRPVSLYSKQN